MKALFTFLAATSALSLAGCGLQSNETQNAEAKIIAPWEDCVGLNFMNTQVRNIGGRWKIVEGSHWAFDFGTNRAEAFQTLRILRSYRVMHSCFVGRPGPSMGYVLTAGGNSPTGNLIAGEDCISFNNATVQVRWFPHLNTWKMVDGNMWMLDFGRNQAEAHLALRVVKLHRFNRQCFVGRPGASFTYWKTNF